MLLSNTRSIGIKQLWTLLLIFTIITMIATLALLNKNSIDTNDITINLGQNSMPPYQIIQSAIANKQQTHKYKQKETENGRKIFIDIGAMTGDTIDAIRRLRPQSEKYQCYAWEPNPSNVVKLKQWMKKYPRMNVTIIQKAAWVNDGHLFFSHKAENDGKIETSPNNNNNKNSYKVESGDISEWILNNFNKNDQILLKMDIESAEFQVLPKMFETKAIDLIDEMQMEWHDWGNFKSKQNIKQREKLEQMLQQNGLIYKFATIDVDTSYMTDWTKVRKFVKPSEYPVQWVDLHYFREKPHSPWDIL